MKDEDLMVQLYYRYGLEDWEIAEKFETNKQRVSGVLRKYMPKRDEWIAWRRETILKNLEASRAIKYKRGYKLARRFVHEFDMDYKALQSVTGLRQRPATIEMLLYLPSQEQKEEFQRQTVARKYESDS